LHLNPPGPFHKVHDAKKAKPRCDYRSDHFPALFSDFEDEDKKYPYMSANFDLFYLDTNQANWANMVNSDHSNKEEDAPPEKEI
jgi:hypothetical protein